VTVMLALPGVGVILWENVVGRSSAVPDGTA